MKYYKGKLEAVPEADLGGGEAPLELDGGAQAEALTMESHLLFVARMRVLEDGALELRRENGAHLPRAPRGSRIKLRGVQRNGQPFCLAGSVGQCSPELWRLEDLEVLQSRERRAYYRQSTDLDARVMPEGHYRGRTPETVECRVLDVSAGGARILSRNVYAAGDRFRLEVALLPEERPFSLICQVLRVNPRKGSKYEYGCRFEDVSETERQRLLETVFEIRRKLLQAKP